MEYVVGFLFDKKLKRVLLIEKNKPAWQKGYLNGVGGKIEDGETPHIAMVREFYEEAGAEINDWKKICNLIVNNYDDVIYYFMAVGDLNVCRQMEEEKLKIVVCENVSYNKNFLVKPSDVILHMCFNDSICFPFEMEYKQGDADISIRKGEEVLCE